MGISFPITTFVLGPLFVLLGLAFPRDLLALAVASSIFQAASVLDINVGGSSFGVPVWIFVLAAATVKSALRRRNRQMKSQRWLRPDRKAVLSVTCYFIYAIFSAFIMPVLFRGVPVSHVREGSDPTLNFGFANLTQCTYLVANAIVLYWCGFHLSSKSRERILTFYISACTFAALVGLYQYVSKAFGLFFPSDVLYSNSTYIHYEAAELAGVYRLNATFTEASVAALYFSGALGIILERCLTAKRFASRQAGLGFLFLLVLVLTVSTTAYLAVSLAVVYFGWRSMFAWRTPKTTTGFRLICLLALVSVSAVLLLNEQASQFIGAAVDAALASKIDTTSYTERQRLNQSAVELLESTAYLGAGLGSCHASSALLQMLGNLGIPGVFAFLFCLWRVLYRRNLYAHLQTKGEALGALAFLLLAHVVAVPDLVAPALWACLGLIIGRQPARPERLLRILEDLPSPTGVPNAPIAQHLNFPHQAFDVPH